jgi:hypothetical protein
MTVLASPRMPPAAVTIARASCVTRGLSVLAGEGEGRLGTLLAEHADGGAQVDAASGEHRDRWRLSSTSTSASASSAAGSSASAGRLAVDRRLCVGDRVVDRAAVDGCADRIVFQPVQELRPRLRLLVQRGLPQLQVGVEHGDLVVVLVLQRLPLVVALLLIFVLLLLRLCVGGGAAVGGGLLQRCELVLLELLVDRVLRGLDLCGVAGRDRGRQVALQLRVRLGGLFGLQLRLVVGERLFLRGLRDSELLQSDPGLLIEFPLDFAPLLADLAFNDRDVGCPAVSPRLRGRLRGGLDLTRVLLSRPFRGVGVLLDFVSQHLSPACERGPVFGEFGL